jgi:hypothetical protein
MVSTILLDDGSYIGKRVKGDRPSIAGDMDEFSTLLHGPSYDDDDAMMMMWYHRLR